MKLFGIIGVWELVIVIVIIAVIFGPAIFVKARKRVAQTGKAAKRGIEAGARRAGVDLDAKNPDGTKKSAADHLSDFQDKVDAWLDDDEKSH